MDRSGPVSGADDGPDRGKLAGSAVFVLLLGVALAVRVTDRLPRARRTAGRATITRPHGRAVPRGPRLASPDETGIRRQIILYFVSYTIQTTLDEPFDAVVDTTTAALKDEGFGVLCDIDVQQTFAEKLDAEFRRYRILGACNPPLAHEALEEEIGLGALLPCNVIVYEADDGSVTVSAVDPRRLVGMADNPALDSVASEVRERFERVLAALDADTDGHGDGAEGSA
jgi:uncharacterized protein (DUF302 family)